MNAGQPRPGCFAIVFDIGATWFRSAVCSPSGELQGRGCVPAVSFHQLPTASVRELQDGLLCYLAAEAERLRARYGCAADAVVSMGAALNGHTGFVFNSGPLWGPRCEPIDLLGELRRRAPAFRWRIVNDVTAALLRHTAQEPERRHGRTALVTISSGIAARVYDHERACVPLDRKHGLQGEIGHLPVAVSFGGMSLELPCDCGGQNHLNAFTSGRGLASVLRVLASRPGTGFEGSLLARRQPGTAPAVPEFAAAVHAAAVWSHAVLDAVLRPLAQVLTVMLVHDPELDPILFCGGVAAGVGETFVNTLCRQLESDGIYQISARDPGYFRDRLRLGHTDDDSGLLGCGVAARIGEGVAS